MSEHVGCAKGKRANKCLEIANCKLALCGVVNQQTDDEEQKSGRSSMNNIGSHDAVPREVFEIQEKGKELVRARLIRAAKLKAEANDQKKEDERGAEDIIIASEAGESRDHESREKGRDNAGQSEQ